MKNIKYQRGYQSNLVESLVFIRVDMKAYLLDNHEEISNSPMNLIQLEAVEWRASDS